MSESRVSSCRRLPVWLLCMFMATTATAAELPPGYWTEQESQAVLDKTVTIRLDPDLSQLSPAEAEAVPVLLRAGEVLHRVYLESRHHQALEALERLQKLDKRLKHPRATRNLLELYRLFKGPIGRGLDNAVVPFLPVDPKALGRNVYPSHVSKDDIEAFLAAHPEERGSILHLRTVVRRATPRNIRKDAERLRARGGLLDVLNPGVARGLQDARSGGLARKNPGGYYAVPYSVAYGDDLLEVHDLLMQAADILQQTDVEFSRYLRHRAVDLLRNDYEAGDAAWVTGRFGNLNAQIGFYESYDDELYGVKTFAGLSLLAKDPVMSASLEVVVKWLQEFEDILPYDARKKVRDDIPVGVYNVIADFGQARGTNTATILPNESYITRKYGRTILIRRNILEDPDIFEIRKDSFRAAVADEFHDDYRPDGDFFRTLFHEIGHYLGPDLDKNGRTLDAALEEDSSILEELKADLVSLYLSKNLFKRGYYNAPRLRAVQAAGVRRVLRKNQPSKTQVYATMELMQLNYFLEKKLLEFDDAAKKLRIHYGHYHGAVESMLREVLSLQYNGNKAAADSFIERYSRWDDDLHGELARAMKDAESYRYVLVGYAALGE